MRPSPLTIALSLAGALALAALAVAAELPGEPTSVEGTLAELNIGEHYLGAQVTKDDLAGKVVLVEYGGL
jgi:hypothetical protein